MLRLRVLTFALVALVATSAKTIEAAETKADPRVARVQKDVQELIRGLYHGDIESILSFTHPAIIEMMGGSEAARATVAEMVQPISRLGMKIESFSFPRAPVFLQGGGRSFVIVPTLMVIAAQGQRVESFNFQLGILEPGSDHWTYVEGSRINKENVQQLFPGFPSNYEFPEFYRKKL